MKAKPFRKTMSALRSRSAFTMVELLMVIAVIAMLAALVVANIGDLGSSRNLENAGSNIRDLISRARNTSRSHNSLTLFVTPRTSNQEDSYKVFAVLERTNDSTEWHQITNWERLPEGIILDEDESESFLMSAQAVTNISLPALRLKNQTINSGSYSYALFSPEGGLISGTDYPPILRFRRESKQDDSNYYDIVINNTTGVPFVKRP